MRRNEPVSGKERRYPPHYHLITTTDIKGRITAANTEFAEVAGFEIDELVGQPHNIIRHPDMPEGAFKHLWETIKAGDSWRGMVKNRCKNGDHYWVDAFVTPIRKHGQIVEFQSVRTLPTQAQIDRAEQVYKAWNQGVISRRFLATSPPLTLKLMTLWLVLAGGVGALTAHHLAPGVMVATQALIFLVFSVLYWLARPTLRIARDTCCDAHPAMPWIYTGRRDEGAWIEFDRQKRNATLRAVSARMHSNIDKLHGRKQRTMEWVSNSVASIRSQQDDIQDITRAFAALGESVARVSELTSQTHEATHNAHRSADMCRDRMSIMNQALSGLETQLATANQRIDRLAERSDSIGLVLEVISGIAEQTNLLALNAAIEAARAGESGRGFAVVADEVRGLAQRTHESTRQIDEMIATLQQETRAVVDVINNGVSCCEETAAVALEASEALDATMTDVSVISDCAQEVASATEEQSALSLQVERQATRLIDLGNDSVKSSESAREESEQLGSNVDQAQLLTSHFLQMLCDTLIPGSEEHRDKHQRFPEPAQ
ncbi:Aerotaxis sensor receptor protein [Marinobacter nitratireducens]|uniref:Aerotaxis sensor receptor protein n=1 Tax=Marinobacter nitratireducens TaxID=1137280 RepID=A0A072N0L0_9GAMM|nr:PAS domain-containing methyl-accepting chemotaxis protein [Marinobacter nitratireducens]KEF30762.1 Aerotaxis sensor receptor protein [Marinobacter nitratireducens]